VSVRKKVLGVESRWLMGRVMAGDFLEGVGKYLHLHRQDRAAIHHEAGIGVTAWLP